MWHNYYPLDEQLRTVRDEASEVEAVPGAPVIPLLCVHGASMQWGGLSSQGVAIVPTGQLQAALGADLVLPAEQVAVLAGTALPRRRWWVVAGAAAPLSVAQQQQQRVP